MAKYLIHRKLADRGDVFNVLYKKTCKPAGGCKPSCSDLSAYQVPSLADFSYSCGCPTASRTFLPEEGKCLANEKAGETLGGAGGGGVPFLGPPPPPPPPRRNMSFPI